MLLSDLVYIDAAGYHYADFPSFLSWQQDQYRAIYGADVYLEADSQDGQYVSAQAQAFYDAAVLGSVIFNGFTPTGAQGVLLSRLVKINGLSRKIPSNSTVDVVIVGQAGTAITDGVAQDSLQQKWNIPNCVIPGGGTITQTAVAQKLGAIAADANTITTIFTPTLGWQSVNNPGAATPGAPVETDPALRIRQTQSTANPSLTVVDGTTGAIANLTGVQKVRTYENDSEITDGNGISAHAISSVVVGGDDVAICQAIADHKTPGAVTDGDTTETVYDAHGMPLAISFQRAVTAEIKATITVTAGPGWSLDFVPLIQNAVATLINSGGAAAAPQQNAGGIGDTVLITKIFAPAYLFGAPAGQTYVIDTIELGKNSGMQSAANVSLDYDENPVCDPTADISVVVA